MTIKSAHLAHTEWGSASHGRPIILLHGLFGSRRNWTQIGKKLSQDAHVFALDLRNHGESDWADGMDYRTMARDVHDFIERHRLSNPVVLGHSMGGKVAMALALHEPKPLAGLIVVDISPVDYAEGHSHNHEIYIDHMMAVDFNKVTRRSQVEEQLDGIDDPMIRTFLLQNVVSDGDGFRWRINLGAIKDGMRDIVDFPPPAGHHVFNGPTLMMSGSKSDYMTTDHRPQIRHYFPQARFTTVKDAAHWVHADKPDVVTKTVRDFLHTLT